MKLRAISIALAAFFLPLAGCEPAAPTNIPVSGKVTLHGQPLDQGTIQFSPAAGQATMSGGEIKDGSYSLSADNGLEPGRYDVRISSSVGGAGSADALPGETKETPKPLIPAEYNSNTTLSVEVTKDGPNSFNFDIP
jgi:hypothetical protein